MSEGLDAGGGGTAVRDVRDDSPDVVAKRDERKFQYPGIPTTCDGSETVVHVEINVTQASGAFPITSSTNMGGGYNSAVMNGYKNLWGDTLIFVEPESEHSAATFCEGFAASGGRVTNFTSGQGLVLMKEVLYTISGKRLPVVMNIGARALTSQSLNVHAGHDDLMSVADVGWGMLFGRNAQESGDLCLISRRAAEASNTPFFNVQDGFLTTHTVEKVRLPELEFMKEFIGKPEDHLVNLMDPANPMMSGVVQNQDSYMKGKIAQRWYYDRVGPALEEAFQLFYDKTGRKYDFVLPYRCDDAEFIIVGMGCYMETCQATVDYLREKKGIPVGCLNVCCFRPFPSRQIIDALKNCTAFTVLERMDDPLSTTGNHLTREIKAAFCDAITGQNGLEKIDKIPRIYQGAAGLGSRDVRPGDLFAVVDNMIEDGPDYFCVGIDHALALKVKEDPDLREAGSFSMRGHSIGGFGSVTTNKVIATIAGDVFGMDVQAYPKYGSEKKGLPTTYYLTIANQHIYLHSELEFVDLAVLNDTTAMYSGNPLAGLVPGGAVIMQSTFNNPKDVWERIPAHHKKFIREQKIHVYFADMVQIARDVASVADLQMRMQGIVLLGAFLRLTPYSKRSGMTDDQVYAGVEKAIRKYFGKRGDRVVQDNMTCIKRGYQETQEVPQELIQVWFGSTNSTTTSANEIRFMSAATEKLPSLNEANERDPYNNNSYGTLVDSDYKLVTLPILDVRDFNERIIRGYEEGYAEKDLPADLSTARSLIPAGTATLRDFSYIAPDIPEYIEENCTGCMDCVTLCPDTAILGKVLSESDWKKKMETISDPADREMFAKQWSKTRKYYEGPAKKQGEGGMFNIMIDPSKCKGCAECVTVCDDLALKMIPKTEQVMTDIRKSHRFFKSFGPSDKKYVSDNLLIDMMLHEKTHIYTGGAGSCAGCGEGTALRMMCAATGAKFGDQWGIIAATGCNTVYTSTYPYNPYLVPWTNSLFENAPAMAMGVRSRWDQMGWNDRPLWCLGGDGAMFDIGFQSLSRMFASGMNIKVFVLDTQVYSNTGGQASTSSYTGQNTKMSVHGKAIAGKQERRKEIAQIAMMHPRTFVAQTTCAHINHFYKSVIDALEFDGPAIVCCYTTCQPEHGVADNMATDQARLAVDTRAFPLLIYDPRKGDTIAERLSLQGNPAQNDDWWTNPKSGQVVDFIDFARSEGRFGKHFDKDGNPSPTLLMAKQDRLENWHVLQDLAGARKKAAAKAEAAKPAAAAKPAVAKPAAAPAKANGNGKSNGEFGVGTRIKYNDGNSWVAGVIASLEPTVLKFDDNTVIETSYDVLKAGAAEGIIVKQ